MGYLRIDYHSDCKPEGYEMRFNPGRHHVEESSNFVRSFEACLGFVIAEMTARTRVSPDMSAVNLQISPNLPKPQRLILEGVVELYNRTPELYSVFQNPVSFRNLAEYFGHVLPFAVKKVKKSKKQSK